MRLLNGNKRIMRDWLQSEFDFNIPKDIFNIIKSELPSDLYDVIGATRLIALIIHRLSEKPWTTQEQILIELDVDKNTLIELNELIYNNEFFQHLIIKEGLGRKYWNTMFLNMRLL